MLEQFEQALVAGASETGVSLSALQVQLMKVHAKHVKEYNEKINLTEITGEEEMAIKHYVDSLTCLAFVPQGASLVDVGTGAGYPGIPIKIARPDVSLTLLDAIQKRTTFLGETLALMGIEATVIHMRTEDFGRSLGRERFDVAVARAVARTNILIEYCLPLVKVGGLFIAMKGPSADEEATIAAKALNTLGGKLESVAALELPRGVGSRRIMCIRKTSKTPAAYPRRAGLPEKKPL